MKSRSTGDAHITMVLVMEMPKTRGCPYYSDVAANFSRSRGCYFSPQSPDLAFAMFLLLLKAGSLQARNFPLLI